MRQKYLGDIRGVIFKEASLASKDFRGVRAGQKLQQKIIFSVVVVLLACSSSILTILSGSTLGGSIYYSREISYLFCVLVISIYFATLISLLFWGFDGIVISFILAGILISGIIAIPFFFQN